MSSASTVRLIDMYMEEASAPLFFSGFFQSPPRNFHNTEKVELDIIRDSEDVAIVITDLSTGGRLNETSLYDNKAFTPPIYKEQGNISAFKMNQRQPGQNPFDDPQFAANATNQAFMIFRKLERKIRRAIELQASQIFQTGQLTLKDSGGNSLYTLDFAMKSTHKVTTTAWATDGSTGNPLADIASLGDVVRRDGKKIPNRLIFGSGGFTRFLANANVQNSLKLLGLNLGLLTPQSRGEGATFQGYIWIGNYRYEMWTYDGFYKDPGSGAQTPFIASNKVVMLTEGARYDLTYGAIPMFVQPDQRVMQFLPGRMSNSDRGLDLTTNAWITPDGENLTVSAGTRPLTIPTAIDTFGCLTVF